MAFKDKSDYEQTNILENKRLTAQIFRWATLAVIILLALIIGCMVGCPQYKVYQQTKEGEAEYKRAVQNRKIKIEEATAIELSATKLAGADTVRAHGIARSQEIIGAKLTPEYLKWFFIDNMEKNQNATFYIPTEAGIPILEAGRANKSPLNP